MKTFLKLFGSFIISSIILTFILSSIMTSGGCEASFGCGLSIVMSAMYAILTTSLIHFVVALVLMSKRDKLTVSKTPYLVFIVISITISIFIVIPVFAILNL